MVDGVNPRSDPLKMKPGTHTYTHIHMYVCMHVCIYIYKHIYMYKHICIYLEFLAEWEWEIGIHSGNGVRAGKKKYTSISIYIYLSIYLSIYINIYIFINKCIPGTPLRRRMAGRSATRRPRRRRKHIYIYIHIYIHTCIFIYIYIYIYIHTHIYIERYYKNLELLTQWERRVGVQASNSVCAVKKRKERERARERERETYIHI